MAEYIPLDFRLGASYNGVFVGRFSLHGWLHCEEVLGRDLELDIHISRYALAMNTIPRGGAFFFNGEAITMQVS